MRRDTAVCSSGLKKLRQTFKTIMYLKGVCTACVGVHRCVKVRTKCNESQGLGNGIDKVPGDVLFCLFISIIRLNQGKAICSYRHAPLERVTTVVLKLIYTNVSNSTSNVRVPLIYLGAFQFLMIFISKDPESSSA